MEMGQKMYLSFLSMYICIKSGQRNPYLLKNANILFIFKKSMKSIWN